ncbi:hypothetical protein KKC60_05655 [Patescibacteria group bacterium]|nr:hypothetical protein [Patescibacteria group bacterium]
MNEEKRSQVNSSSQVPRNTWVIIFSVLITAIVIGGTNYAWHSFAVHSLEQAHEIETSILHSQINELRSTYDDNKQKNFTKSANQENWINYKNEKRGYSISYPKDWEVNEYNEGEIYIHYPGWRQMPEGGGSVVISVEEKTLEQFIQEYNLSDVHEDGVVLSEIFKQENYALGNKNGYKLVGTTAMGLDQSFIFITHNDQAYVIQFHDYDDAHLEIIETFQFND